MSEIKASHETDDKDAKLCGLIDSKCPCTFLWQFIVIVTHKELRRLLDLVHLRFIAIISTSR